MTQHRGFPTTRPGPWRLAGRPVLAPLLALLGALALPDVAARAGEASGWATSAHSEARLIGAGLAPAGTAPGDAALLAGIEVRLDPHFITYWRDPGDAGVPPAFDFAGSANLKAAELRYPAPGSLDEAGAKAFGYRDDVVFPVIVTPLDPAKPVKLAVRFDYAVCSEICLPAHASLRVALDRDASAEAGRVRDALAAVPRPETLGDTGAALEILAVRPEAAGGFSVLAAVPGRDKAAVPGGEKAAVPGGDKAAGTLLVEAPEGWAYEAGPAVPEPSSAPGAGQVVFPVKLLDRPKGAGRPDGPVILTLVTPAGAIEVPVQLDAVAPKP